MANTKRNRYLNLRFVATEETYLEIMNDLPRGWVVTGVDRIDIPGTAPEINNYEAFYSYQVSITVKPE